MVASNVCSRANEEARCLLVVESDKEMVVTVASGYAVVVVVAEVVVVE